MNISMSITKLYYFSNARLVFKYELSHFSQKLQRFGHILYEKISFLKKPEFFKVSLILGRDTAHNNFP